MLKSCLPSPFFHLQNEKGFAPQESYHLPKATPHKISWLVSTLVRDWITLWPTPSPTFWVTYLRGGAAGEPGQLADARGGRGVAGADEDRGTDLHGVAVLGRLGGLVGHGEGREGVPLFGVFLGVGVL